MRTDIFKCSVLYRVTYNDILHTNAIYKYIGGIIHVYKDIVINKYTW